MESDEATDPTEAVLRSGNRLLVLEDGRLTSGTVRQLGNTRGPLVLIVDTVYSDWPVTLPG